MKSDRFIKLFHYFFRVLPKLVLMLFVTVFLLPNLGKLSKFCHVFSIKRKFLKVVSCFQKEETHPNFVMLFPENENSQNCVMFFSRTRTIIQILSCVFSRKRKILLVRSEGGGATIGHLGPPWLSH